jgi:hypothetical protein
MSIALLWVKLYPFKVQKCPQFLVNLLDQALITQFFVVELRLIYGGPPQIHCGNERSKTVVMRGQILIRSTRGKFIVW